MKVFLFAILLIIVKCDNEFQDSSKICELCDCNRVVDILQMNCTDRSITNTLANWPNEKPPITKLIVSFSYNKINRLKRMAGTGLQLKISYDHCGIKDIESDLFESCSNVTYLDLSYNNIESDDLLPGIFKGQYKKDDQTSPIALEELHLAYNKIHSIHKALFTHLPYLRVLNLAGNHLRILDIHTSNAITSIPLLYELNLADNRLTELPAAAIKNDTQLQILNLSNNELDFPPLSLQFISHKLKKLYLDNNPIINLDGSFIGMEDLEELTLNNLTKLREIRTNTFNSLISVKRIELNHNKVLSEIQDEAFGGIRNLQELHLSGTNLTNLPKSMIFWQQLKVLNIRENSFICTCNLYEIAQNLSESIKLDRDEPFCLNQRTLQRNEIYNLQKDICLEPVITDLRFASNNRDYSSYKIMKMSMVMMIILIMVLVSFGMWLAYAKWKKIKRNNNYSFVSQVAYNPLNV